MLGNGGLQVLSSLEEKLLSREMGLKVGHYSSIFGHLELEASIFSVLETTVWGVLFFCKNRKPLAHL